jgi:hypothetical protein
MTRMDRFRANRPRVVDETIDGEALLMDMVSGSYFGCDGPSAVAWAALSGGHTVDELAAALADRLDVDVETVRADGARFLEALVAAQLVVADPDAGVPAIEPLGLDELQGPYVALAIDEHRDLADLLLLDPVHDVSEEGWPHQKQ